MRKLLAVLFALGFAACSVVAVAHAGFSDMVNALPTAGARFMSVLQDWIRREDADRMYETHCQHSFVVSGCLGGTEIGLTHTPTSCIAYAKGYRLTETGSITYPDESTCWIIADRNVTGDLTTDVTWTRIPSTHYLRACPVATPTFPSNTDTLMRVTTTGGAITAVVDLREFLNCCCTSTTVTTTSTTTTTTILDACPGPLVVCTVDDVAADCVDGGDVAFCHSGCCTCPNPEGGKDCTGDTQQPECNGFTCIAGKCVCDCEPIGGDPCTGEGNQPECNNYLCIDNFCVCGCQPGRACTVTGDGVGSPECNFLGNCVDGFCDCD